MGKGLALGFRVMTRENNGSRATDLWQLSVRIFSMGRVDVRTTQTHEENVDVTISPQESVQTCSFDRVGVPTVPNSRRNC